MRATSVRNLLVSYVCLGKRIHGTETQGRITRECEKASRNIWTSEPKNKKGPTGYGRSDRIPSGENSIPDMTGGNEFFFSLSSSQRNEALLVRRATAKRVFSISCDRTNKLTFSASVQSLLLFTRKFNNLQGSRTSTALLYFCLALFPCSWNQIP